MKNKYSHQSRLTGVNLKLSVSSTKKAKDLSFKICCGIQIQK